MLMGRHSGPLLFKRNSSTLPVQVHGGNASATFVSSGADRSSFGGKVCFGSVSGDLGPSCGEGMEEQLHE